MRLNNKNYRHTWLALFFVVYIFWFFLVEKLVTGPYTSMQIFIDKYIPFCEYFVIPYVLWYPYMGVVALFLLFREEYDFCRYMWTMIIGLSFCLTVYLVFPNGQDLRPESFERSNFFTWLVGSLYSADSNKNVFPSMHVYGTIAPLVAILKTKALDGKRLIKISAFVLGVLICLSTVFIKQHSVLDVIGGVAVFIPIYYLTYHKGKNWKLWTWPASPFRSGKRSKQPKQQKKKRLV